MKRTVYIAANDMKFLKEITPRGKDGKHLHGMSRLIWLYNKESFEYFTHARKDFYKIEMTITKV